MNKLGQLICGPCAGVAVDPVCGICGRAGDLYAAGTCDRCVLKDRVHSLLAGPDGNLALRLLPLVSALEAVPQPRHTLSWLQTGAAARQLVQLAQQPEPLTHELIDGLASVQAQHYLRGILVHTEVLPEREEHLERIAPWMDRLLAEQPDHISRLIRPFAHWHVLSRARRNARRRGFTFYSARFPRACILAALELLTWFDVQGKSFDTIDQHDVNNWLATGPSRRYNARYFLDWATRHNLITAVTVPARPRKQPGRFLTDEDHTNQLRRCINDTDLAPDVRLAGALILLFGITIQRVLQLTTNDLDQRGDGTYLRLGNKPVQLPPRLAHLVHHLVQEPGEQPAVSHATGQSPFLFPGMIAGRPRNPNAFAGRLAHHGLTGTIARNTARRALATDLPAPIIADLFGMHINTAVGWVRQNKRDWAAYLSARTSSDSDVRSSPARNDGLM